MFLLEFTYWHFARVLNVKVSTFILALFEVLLYVIVVSEDMGVLEWVAEIVL